MALHAVGVALFVALIGHRAANLIFGLLIAIHAGGVLWFLRAATDPPPLWTKLAMSGCVVALLGLALYWPGLRFAEQNLFVPLRTAEGVIVINCRSSPESVRAGDLVAYAVPEQNLLRMRIAGGFGLERVLARAGDTVEFTATAVLVNGQPHPKQPGMPPDGSAIVPANHWFIWPEFDIRQNGVASVKMMELVAWQYAFVPFSDFVGRPFRHWFGRRQGDL